MLTVEQCRFRRVDVIWDLESLILIFYFCNYSLKTVRSSCSYTDAAVGSDPSANMAVSSANIPTVIVLDVDKSEVYNT